jgi:hypothetical protein
LLILAEARGLSGILIASTPTDFKNRALSTSLRMSVPFGGTISTMVTNSRAASFAPSRDRFSTGSAGAACGATSAWGFADPTFARASPTRRAFFIIRICSGVVPQHPPINCAPAATNFRA